jgi:hypothetical protein
MEVTKRKVQYFYATVEDRPGAAFRLLAKLAESDVNLLAFSATPTGPNQTQVVLFPEDPHALAEVAEQSNLVLTGPQSAFLIQGDDRLGALTEVHRVLADAKVNVFNSTGVTDGRGGFGYIIYVRPEDIDRAAHVLVV